MRLRTVADTNIIIAGLKNPDKESPNKRYITLWLEDKFDFLYSDDTQNEYIEKLIYLNIPERLVEQFIIAIKQLACYVPIKYFHLPAYPPDFDDIAFVLCAYNGNATHLISNDKHLLYGLKYSFEFTVCKVADFLKECKSI
jgi:uncharacterized protein